MNLFPRDKAQYFIIAAAADSPTIFKAKHANPETGTEVPVGIKIVKNMIQMEDFYFFATQLHEAESLDHENIFKIHCSFKIEDELWIVTSPPGFSVRSMLRFYFRQGLPEISVGFVLKETLKALHYVHGKNKLHGNVGPDCIFLDGKSRLKLAHSSLIYEHHRSHNFFMDEDDHRSEKSSILALEIMAYYGIANDKATDVLMFGFLALELFYGRHILACDFDEFQVLVRNVKFWAKDRSNNNNVIDKLGFLSCFHGQKKKKVSKLLAEVMAACLSRDPKKRPTTDQLLEFNFFKKTFTSSKLMKKTASL